MIRPDARRKAHVRAEDALVLDILTGVLGRVASPVRLGDYLTAQMRELTGTRTVVLLQYPLQGTWSDPRVVSVCPARRSDSMVPSLCGRFARVSAENGSSVWTLEDAPPEARVVLEALACGNGMGLALNVASVPVGALLFFDLPEGGRRAPEVLSLLAPLATVVALALRNALLFEQQEAVIEERTRQIRETEASKAELQLQLAHAQRMESIGRLAGGVAILAHAELARMQLAADSPLRDDLDAIGKAAARARDVVRQILAFSRQEQQPRQLVDVHGVVREALSLLRASLPSTIEIREALEPRCGRVLAVPGEIYQVLMNLGTNALDAMRPGGGTLGVVLEAAAPPGAENRDQEGAGWIHLAVSDTGHGMDAGTAERIFDPYFTTKPTGRGTGLGLAVVHGIVSGCGGLVQVTSAPGKGSRFDVYLPRQAAEAGNDRDTGGSCWGTPAVGSQGTEEWAGAAKEGDKTVSATQNARSVATSQMQDDGLGERQAADSRPPRVLVVDDEPAIAGLARRILKNAGYEVTALTDSSDALALVTRDPLAFDLVITDHTLPRMTGAQLITEILALRPSMPTVICTGYSETLDEERALAIGARALVMKPFDVETLARVARRALEGAVR